MIRSLTFNVIVNMIGLELPSSYLFSIYQICSLILFSLLLSSFELRIKKIIPSTSTSDLAFHFILLLMIALSEVK